MVPWLVLVLIFDALLIVGVIFSSCQCNTVQQLILTIGIALASVIGLIRVFLKVKEGHKEKLSTEVNDLRKENKELLERIAAIREKQINERTDQDLV